MMTPSCRQCRYKVCGRSLQSSLHLRPGGALVFTPPGKVSGTAEVLGERPSVEHRSTQLRRRLSPERTKPSSELGECFLPVP